MSNEAFAQGLRSVLFPETSIENGVPNAVQSSAGRGKVASEVDLGISEDEGDERGKTEADSVGERDIDDGLLNGIRALLSVSRQKKISPPFPFFFGDNKAEKLRNTPPRLSPFSYSRVQHSS